MTIKDEVLDQVRESVRKQKEPNGDIGRILLIVADNNEKLETVRERIDHLEKNPAVVIGKYSKKYPTLAWVAFMVLWVIAGAGATVAVFSFLTSVGF